MFGPAQWLVALVALQRLGELIYAGSNARRLRAAGAIEIGAGHYPAIIAVHGAWLLAVGVLVPVDAPVIWPWLGLYVLLQFGRAWVLMTLRRSWTTRILTTPDVPLVAHGPYRFCRHPNYLIVAAEIAMLPMIFGAWQIALAFSALNAIALVWRIRAEDRALAARRLMIPICSR